MDSSANPRKFRLSWFLGLALIAAALAGCAQPARASGSIFVKDAPTDDASNVYVTFTKAQVRHEGSATWTTIFQGNKTVDLLAYRDANASAKLSDFGLSPGKYNGLRIAVSSVRLVLKNGTQEALAVHGNVVTLAEKFEVSSAGQVKLLVDFNLEKGIDLANETFSPKVGSTKVVTRDDNHDGKVDFNDTDEGQVGDGTHGQNGKDEPDQVETDESQIGDWNDSQAENTQHVDAADKENINTGDGNQKEQTQGEDGSSTSDARNVTTHPATNATTNQGDEDATHASNASR